MRRAAFAFLFLLLLLTYAAPLPAQPEWRGPGRLLGDVAAADGSPLAGAEVRVAMLDAPPGQGPEPATTDRRGRFVVSGLAIGRWEITIDAPGHIRARGIAGVGGGPAKRMAVRLRSLDEVTPFAAEGNPNAVADWRDAGDSFLRDGRPAQARAEYGKALAASDWREHAPLLQAIARTYFLEGDGDAALRHVRHALMVEPDNAGLRQLLGAVAESLERPGEAERILAALPAEPTEPPRSEAQFVQTGPPPTYPEHPLLDPEPHRTGRFRLRLTERSPLGSLEEVAQRHGVTPAEALAGQPGACGYDLADETFEVFVPDGYDAGTPHALFVWVSPTPFGGTERPEFQALLAERGILWIGANRAGNARARFDRTALALDAAQAMQALYNIDERRIWVGGYSGGGRTAGGLAMLWPEVFTGGLFVMGCDFYERLPVSHRPGAAWPAAFPAPSGATLSRLQKEHRFVMLTGSRDFNLSSCRAVHAAYVERGFEHATFIELPGISHYDRVPLDGWERALTALEPAD